MSNRSLSPNPLNLKPDAGRRVDLPSMPGMPQRRPEQSVNEMRKLIVGRDIAMSGEISSCDFLVVEGTVEARLREGHRIEITETGLFRGTVEISEADIGGRFEGELSVTGRLTVRGTGRIDGTIRYGQLEVEAGGQLEGEVRGLSTPRGAPGATTTPPAVAEVKPAETVESEPALLGDTP